MSKQSNKKAIKFTAIILSVLFVCGLLVGVTVLSSNDESKNTNSSQSEQKSETATYKDPTTGLTVSYLDDLRLVPYNPPNQDSVLFNLTKTDPKILVTAWYRDSDPGVALNTKEIIKKFDETYKDAVVTSEKLVTINGYKGAEVVFTHVSANLDTTQRLTVLMKDENTAVTIACQALTANYAGVNEHYFDRIINSAKFE